MPGHPAARLLSTPPHTTPPHPIKKMTQTIYRVEGLYASGRYVSHLVGADNVTQAIASVEAADSRIIRITSAKPTLM